MPKLNSISDFNTMRRRLRSRRTGISTLITICGGTGCQASRSQDVIDAVKKELKKQKLGRKVSVRVTGCHGFCEQGPIMVLEPGNIFYCHLKPEDASDIVTKTLLKGEVIDRLLIPMQRGVENARAPLSGQINRSRAPEKSDAPSGRHALRHNNCKGQQEV